MAVSGACAAVRRSRRHSTPERAIPDASTAVDHPSGFLALAPRNQRFTVSGIAGFVAYRVQGRHLIALGGIHAPAAQRGALLDAFIAHAAANRRRVMVVQLRADQVPLFIGRGFAVNQLGSSFSLSLAGFALGGTRKMQLRNKISRARAAGLHVVELGVDGPRDAASFERLHAVSRQWLRAKRRKELDFMIGEIGLPEDRERRIFAAVNRDGSYVAFISYVPAWGSMPGYLHDLSRRLPDAPPGALELCNVRAIETMKAEGVTYLHFGFTPFIVGDEEFPGANRIAAWLVPRLFRYGQAVYPAATQVQYKLKWTPDIVEREYLAARPLSLRAIFDLLVLTRSL
jgi:lysylphosphatidylglycerol synthetase-like protein (DUF2156 family)